MSIGFPIIGRRRCVLENTAFHQFLFSIREKINGTPGINYGKLHSVLAAKRERGSGARTDEPIGKMSARETRDVFGGRNGARIRNSVSTEG